MIVKRLNKGIVIGSAASLLMVAALGQPVLAEGETDLIDRIRPVGKVKISADKDIALAESLSEPAQEASPEASAVAETKEAVIEAVDQAAEATKEVVEKAAEVAETAVAAVDKTVEAATEVAATVAESVASASVDGQQIYNKTCFACHGTGIPGFPKVGDKVAWADRIGQGDAALYDHAINGFKGMPARGGDAGLSDEEIKAAVDYMVAESK